jgi:ATP-binding protein involved in chromosome partitioning
MSYFLCPSDGKRYDIFGSGGGEREAARLKVPPLGQIPMDIASRESGDRGLPIVAADEKCAIARALLHTADQIARGCVKH